MGLEWVKLADGWAQNLGPWGYVVLAAAALVEYIFPPFPGDSLVALGGIWARRTSQSWLCVWIAVTSGNALGIALQHRLGCALASSVQGAKSGWPAKKLKDWGVTNERIAVMQERIRARGVTLLLINRFFPSFRALVFLAAGASGLSLKRTLCWGVLGSLIWSAFILSIGVWVGGNAEQMLALLARYQMAAAWVTVAVIVLWVLYKLYKWKR